MNKPRILMIAPLPPPVHGSAMMTQYLKDSRLINEQFKLDWVNLSTSRSMDEIGKKSVKKLLRFGGSYLKTLFKLLTRSYDCCYLAITCHGKGFLKDAPFVLLCKVFRLKVIIHQHNKGMKQDVSKRFYKWLFKKVYANSKVILLSWRLYPDIQQIVQREQIVVCPNGIPQTTIYPKSDVQHVSQILFLSNLIESKGVMILLDACKTLQEEGYNFRCKFIGGETKEIDSLRLESEIAVRGLNDKVEYIGKKYGEAKDKELAMSDILVFPTYYENETFGLVLLEAMQQRTPVITTDVGAIPDIIEDGKNGLICSTQDYEGLAQKIKVLLDSPQRAIEIGLSGKKTFEERYTLEVWQKNMAFIFSTIVNQNNES